MSARCFVDTNILVYAAKARVDDAVKYEIANRVIQAERFCVSAQVLQEFYVAVQKRDPRNPLASALPEPEAAEWVGWLEPFCEVATDAMLVQQSIEIARKHRISYWDAAIVAAAQRAGALVVYSEDINHGQLYGDVRVMNPFRAP